MNRRKHPGYTKHNKATLIRGGKDYFQLLEQLIALAKYSIHFQIYIFDDDETGRLVKEALINASMRGVKVYVVVDGYASQGLSRAFINEMREAGIYFRRFEPLLKSRSFYVGRRMHHKIVVVDRFHGLVAGLNVSNRYNDTEEGPPWLDWALHVEGEASLALEKICGARITLRGWIRRKKAMETTPVDTVHESCEVGILVNDWFQRRAQITRRYLEMFRQATTHVIIMSPYFLPGYEFRRAIRMASNRGVKIQVVLAGISDIPLSKSAERYMYRWLFRNKVEIFEYQKSVLHGKMAVFDGSWMTVGSYNINNLSAYASIELNLEVNDKAVAGYTEKQLTAIIKNDCVQITEEAYSKSSPWLQRVKQQTSYNLFRVLLYLSTFGFKQKE